MKRILFLTDLDNTLLYSRSHSRPGDRCIEWIHGSEQGYMSENTIRMLNHLPTFVELVSVTSRSIAQYQRIQWPCTAPQKAVCTNGAVLLQGAIEDEDWRRAAATIIEPCRKQLIELKQRLMNWDCFLRVRMVDNAYLFAYCSNDVWPADILKKVVLPDGIVGQVSGKKALLFP